MKLGEYLEIANKMKAARTAAGISQKEMAEKLNLTTSGYSNYENGYTTPPVEVLLDFCNVINVSFDTFLGTKVATSDQVSVTKFSDLLSIIIDLDLRGLPIKGHTTYEQKDNRLVAHLDLEFASPQLASFIPDWSNMNHRFKSGLIDEDEYKAWITNSLRIFNVPIDDYI